MIVCVCHRVSDRDIARVTREGCASFEDLQFELSVATGCGRCHDCARETFHHHRSPPNEGLDGSARATGPAHGPSVRIKLIPLREAAHAAGA